MNEFELIKTYFAPLSVGEGGAYAYGLQDDAALITFAEGSALVTTVDALVEGVHFFPKDPADLVARKLLRVNLSDLAAMGASPRAYLLTVGLPKTLNEEWLQLFAEGLRTDQEHFAIHLIGGDTTHTSGPAFFSLTAFGEIAPAKALLRSGAKPGDFIFVSGQLGEAALGLLVREGLLPNLPEAARDELLARYLLPEPRVALGEALAGLASAAIDISDGLIADLRHITESSQVKAILELTALPLSQAVLTALSNDQGLWEKVLAGGDDYELLFTLAPEQAETLVALSERLALPLTRIGTITAGTGVEIRDQAGREVTLSQEGWKHF